MQMSLVPKPSTLKSCADLRNGNVDNNDDDDDDDDDDGNTHNCP